MPLDEIRRAIRPLLRPQSPADALAAYFAFHHPDSRTRLVPYPPDSPHPTGYVCISRTGMDLFRPLVTLRLPPQDMTGSAELIYAALRPETAVFLNVPEADYPLISALFQIRSEEHLALYQLDPARFEPVVNVLVTQAEGPNGLPRFVIRSDTADGQVVAAASLNWQSPDFAEIGVMTLPGYRRQGWGRSVVAALVRYLLANGRMPLYAVSLANEASRSLAAQVGFVDTGSRAVLAEGTLRPHPL
ncbi:MAG: GNAT family N-acetyltransferase, partial [Anaerolineales bacterium]|nr:GNAT family N-acetyltransferase [Anaerolineales bacterium]